MKLTKKQIDIIIKNTKPELKGTFPVIVETLGYYTKSECNWSYRAGFTSEGFLVVTVFGEVR